MNPRVEKFLKMPLYKRLALLGGGVVLIVGLTVWFLGMPKYEELTRLRQEAATLDAQIAQKQVVAANLGKFMAEYAKLGKQLELALTRLPNQSEIPTLLTSLAGLAKDNGLEVQSFKPGAEVPKGFFAEVPADMSLYGTYHQVAMFAGAVSNLPRIVNLNDMSLGRARYVGNKAIIEVTCRVLTFRFIDTK